MNAVDDACHLMQAFLERTGILADDGDSRRRYLWTDAFAVQTCLGLARETGDQDWEAAARSLIDQVHCVLGRHRDDDARDGWISCLPDAEGAKRPTAGGLRIGKPLPERAAAEAGDAGREWDQDGQYFHYLTRWMQALFSAFHAIGEIVYAQYARDLAIASGRFIAAEGTRMYWKMSIDLTYPLVPSMGMHDPLDGLVCLACIEQALGEDPPLTELCESLESLCEGRQWATADPLGIGGAVAERRSHRAA